LTEIGTQRPGRLVTDFGTVCLVPVSKCRPHPAQTREYDDEIVESIAATLDDPASLVEPIKVLPVGDVYYIVSGEQRWRAFRKRGWDKIPAIIVEDDGHGRVLDHGRANLIRKDLTVPEKAAYLRKVADEYGLIDSKGHYRTTELARLVFGDESKQDLVSKLLLASKGSEAAVKILLNGGRSGDAKLFAGVARLVEPGDQEKLATLTVDRSLHHDAVQKIGSLVLDERMTPELKEALLTGAFGDKSRDQEGAIGIAEFILDNLKPEDHLKALNIATKLADTYSPEVIRDRLEYLTRPSTEVVDSEKKMIERWRSEFKNFLAVWDSANLAYVSDRGKKLYFDYLREMRRYIDEQLEKSGGTKIISLR